MKLVFRLLSLLVLTLVVSIFGGNRYISFKHDQAILIAKGEENLSEIVGKFGDPIYSSSESGWPPEWFDKQFVISLDANEYAHVFHPPGTWPNFLIVVVSDSSGKIHYIKPYET